MAAIRSFVTIKPIATKTSVGTNLNEIRKGINRTGLLMEGIAKNYAETAKLIQFEREWLRSNAQSKVADINEEEKKEQSIFAKSMQNLRKAFSRKKRDESEAAAEGEKEAEKEDGKLGEAVKKPVKSFLEAIGSLLGTIGKYFLIFGALNWLEKNPESAVKFFKLVWAIGKFSFQLTKLGIGGIMDGLTNLFGDFSSNGMKENVVKRGLRFFIGALQLAGGLAMLRFASYLIMPWRLFQDVNTIRNVFLKQAQSEAEMKASAEARKTGYKDSRTGIVYTKEEYEAIKKSARRADEKRAKRAGKGMKSELYQNELGQRFQAQYEGKSKGRVGKLQQRGRIAGKKMTRSISKFAKANPGKVAAGFSVLGGGLRIAGGLAAGESAGKAVGAGVGQAAGGIIGGIAGTALLGPFLGPFAPIVGNAIGSFLGEWVGGVLGPIVEPIFKPIGRYFGMLFDVIGSAMEPFKESFGELFSALFDFVGQIGNLVMQVATILWDFYKFVYGPIFSVIGDVVGFVVENAKRMMDPGSVAQGIADSFTFNIFDFDKKNKKAAGGPVDAPSRAMGGPIGPMSVTQAPVLAAVGNTMLDAVVGGIGGFGFAGAKALGFISGDVARLRTTFGTTGGIGVSGSPRGAMKTAITLQKTSAANLAGSTDKGASEQLYRAVSDEDKGLKGVLLKAIRIFDANYGKGNATSGGGGGGGGGAPAGGGDGSGYSGDPGNVAVSGDVVTKGVEISKKIMSDTGATKQAAAAIAGNMAHESAGFVPGIREGGPFGRSSKPWPKGTVGKGYGWAQWTNHRPGSRYDAFIKSYGGDYNKVPTNADNYRFLMQELMQGNGGFISKGQGTSGSFAEFKKKTDVANATVDFRKTWERAGVAHDESRINYANKFLAKMAKGGLLKFDGGGEYNPDGSPKDFRIKKRKKDDEKMPLMAGGGILAKLGDGTKLASAPRGYCTTGVLETMAANGVPNPPGTGNDGNNPRGLMAQAIKSYGWGSLPYGKPINLNSPYGKVGANMMNFAEWKQNVKAGNIPSGALVFSTRNANWNSNGPSSGHDSAIAKKGGAKLWSGHWQTEVDGVGAVYGAGTRAIVALTPGGANVKYDPKRAGADADSADGASGSGASGGGGGEAPQEPETVESMQKKLEDLLNQFGKAMSDTKKGFQLPAQEKPQTTAPSPTPAGSIQPATTVNAEQLKKAKEMEAKAIRDKESDMFVPAPTVIQQTIQQPVINNVGQSNTVVIRGTPSPMLTGRPRRTNH
jgi:hypothetical protein